MKNLTKKQQKELKKIIKEEAKHAKDHFKNYGWDLRYSFIEDEIYYQFFGQHLESEIFKEFFKFSKLKIKKTKIGDTAVVFSLSNPAVFYNTKTNKLVVKDDHDKASKNLEFIGEL